MRDIGIWEPRQVADVQDSALAFDVVRHMLHYLHRASVGVLLLPVGQQRDLSVSHRRFRTAPDDLCHEQAHFVGALVGVGVRVLVIGHANCGEVDHLCGDVAVQIQLDDDRNVRSNDLTHGAQNIAFTVVVDLGNHCAVQR